MKLNIYTSVGICNLRNDSNFGDSRFQTLGSRTFEIGFTTGFRLLKTNNLFHINYGIAWMHNGLKFKESEYFVRENDVTKSVPYTANKLSKSKLRTNYLIVPIDFEFDFTPPETEKGVTVYPTHESFRVGFGGYVGVAIGDSQKIKYNNGGDTYKTVMRNDLNVSPFIYGTLSTLGIQEFFYLRALQPRTTLPQQPSKRISFLYRNALWRLKK